MSQRFRYQVIEIKPGIMGGFKPENLQQELEHMGMQGWELVQIVTPAPLGPMHAVFKKGN